MAWPPPSPPRTRTSAAPPPPTPTPTPPVSFSFCLSLSLVMFSCPNTSVAVPTPPHPAPPPGRALLAPSPFTVLGSLCAGVTPVGCAGFGGWGWGWGDVCSLCAGGRGDLLGSSVSEGRGTRLCGRALGYPPCVRGEGLFRGHLCGEFSERVPVVFGRVVGLCRGWVPSLPRSPGWEPSLSIGSRGSSFLLSLYGSE